MKQFLVPLVLAAVAATALAKLPAPDDATKAKAAEAAAKTAWQGKVDGFQLCKSQDRTAAHYRKTAGKSAAAPATTAPCADPGPFVYTPAVAAPAAGAAAAPASAPASAKKA